MKKIRPYFLISTAVFIISIILSHQFEFSLSNSWQAGIVTPCGMGPYWIYCWKLADFHKVKHPLLCGFSKFCLIFWAISFAIATLLFILIGW